MKKHSLHKKTFVVLAIVISFLSFACSNNDDAISIIDVNPASIERGAIISYQKIGSLTASQIAKNGLNIGDVSKFTSNAVDIYKVVYNSIYFGELTQVSGLVIIPKNVNGDLQLVQHHHGTIIPIEGSEGEVPSNYTSGYTDSNVETSFIGATIASNGYVVSLPDYVGYGVTSHLEHPYTVHHELAEVSVDMIKATKNLLKELSIGFSNNVFLTGWSEGGGAGLATHKYLQLNYPEEVTIKASSLLAGPYNYDMFLFDVIENNTEIWGNLDIYNWSIYALNKFNTSLTQPQESIWKYSVTNQLEALEIPSEVPSDILKQEFLDGLNNRSNAAFINVIRENSLIDNWTPVGHLFFHSGTEDKIVPHYNSTIAHKRFEFVAAKTKLYEYQGGDHYTPLLNYVITTLNDFNDL